MRCDVKKEGHVGGRPAGRPSIRPPVHGLSPSHRNHGLLTASRHSIESAAFWFIALERCCRQQLMIEATGRPPVLVPPERARYSRERVGTDYIGSPSSRSTAALLERRLIRAGIAPRCL